MKPIPIHQSIEEQMIQVVYIVLILVGMAGCQGSEPPKQLVMDRVQVEVPQLITVRAGEVGEGEVQVEIREGYHIQANPVPLPYLIPTALEVEGGAMQPGIVKYPEGIPYSLYGSTDTLLVYDGRISIRFSVAAPDSLVPGDYELVGTLTYQSCDDRMCFLPVREPVVVHVQVNL